MSLSTKIEKFNPFGWGASRNASLVNSSLEFMAATDVAMPPTPSKLSNKRVAIPSYLTSANPSKDSFLPLEDLGLANYDITEMRTTTTTPATIRKLSKASPDLSAAIFSALRLALSNGYVALARDLDGTLNSDATRLAQQLCRRFDLLSGATAAAKGGYNHLPSIRSAAESIGKEILMHGAGAIELLLDKTRYPEGLQPVSVEKIKFKYDGNRKVPYQVLGGVETLLDIATFFYISLDQDLTIPDASSPVQAAIQPILAQQAFMNDLRRVAQRAVHPRVKVKIVEEMWRKTLSTEVLNDPDLLAAAAAALIASVKDQFDNLNPEDAVIFFDCLTVEYLTGGSTTVSDEWKALSGIINGKISSGAKSAPVVLGLDSVGSSNIASTQTMLFVKTVESGIIHKLNEMFSRLLTTAVRVHGVDAVVEFSFDPVDLRPTSELEAFKSMKQGRYLKLLSLGLISDEEASIVLTGTLPPAGMKPLSGTFFDAGGLSDIEENPESNTSALNQDLAGDAPKGSPAEK
jgi:hypothetical protein